MNADDLKNAWRETGMSLDRSGLAKVVAEQVAYELRKNRNRTALDNLRNSYLRFAILAAVMCPVSPAMFNSGIFYESDMTLVSVVFSVFFALAASIDFSFFRGLGKIDCNTIPVGEVARMARRYRKRHLQSILLLMPLALSCVGLLVYFMRDEVYVLAGIAAGGLFGLVVGFRNLFKFMNEYRELSRKED